MLVMKYHKKKIDYAAKLISNLSLLQLMLKLREPVTARNVRHSSFPSFYSENYILCTLYDHLSNIRFIV